MLKYVLSKLSAHKKVINCFKLFSIPPSQLCFALESIWWVFSLFYPQVFSLVFFLFSPTSHIVAVGLNVRHCATAQPSTGVAYQIHKQSHKKSMTKSIRYAHNHQLLSIMLFSFTFFKFVSFITTHVFPHHP